MPVYDFACDTCGAEFEERTEPGATPRCPSCDSDETRRLFRPIAPPARIGLRGAAAKRSNAQRAAREEKKRGG
jgi:putative FmdB family regulatory protein